ncbi:MAG: pyruvate ferredoxin oxidoreductase [Candidatus Cloacimonas sp. 4484_209]|nr:MAG: pyruvate ferredoxin oxidoreductase [Candidatus Cloacimonas sp. 4484_209]
MIEIRFHGRGGQGTVVASKILAEAFFLEGHYVQSYPQYGVERRGAPVTAFLRIGEKDEKLFVRSHIYEPDLIIVLDPTLLESINVFDGLKEGGWVVMNTTVKPEELSKTKRKYNFATVDASGIAIKWGLGSKAQPIVNTAILGGFARATGNILLNSLKKAIVENAPIKPENNAKAAEDAYNSVKF